MGNDLPVYARNLSTFTVEKCLSILLDRPIANLKMAERASEGTRIYSVDAGLMSSDGESAYIMVVFEFIDTNLQAIFLEEFPSQEEMTSFIMEMEEERRKEMH